MVTSLATLSAFQPESIKTTNLAALDMYTSELTSIHIVIQKILNISGSCEFLKKSGHKTSIPKDYCAKV